MKKEIKKMLRNLKRSVVRTPDTREELEDLLLDGHRVNYLSMQIAIQFGYKMALEDLLDTNKLRHESDNINESKQ